MKINNLELAIAMGDFAIQHPKQNDLMQLATYLAEHPTSQIFYEQALREMGIDPRDVPQEAFGTPIPPGTAAIAEMKDAINYLNAQWRAGKLHQRVAVRRLAWASTLLARRLDADAADDATGVVKANGGSTAGLFKAYVPQAMTRSEVAAILQAPLPTNGESHDTDAHPAPAA